MFPFRFFARLSHSLFAKFLLILGPVFILTTVPGIWVIVDYETRENRDVLAARIGNNASRVATALSRLPADVGGWVVQDVISMVSVDRAFLCAEFIGADGRRIATHPPVIGCAGQEHGQALTLPVDDDGRTNLRVRYTDEELVEDLELEYSIATSIVAFAFVVAIIASAIGFRLIVQRPLSRLQDAIRLMSETGRRVEVPVRSRDELRTLIHAYNEMSARDETRKRDLVSANAKLERSREVLKQLNDDLEHRVQERTAELEAEKENAEAANRAKSTFLANMSHELRTPLNSVIGFADIMRQGRVPGGEVEKYRQFAEDIHESGVHLLNIINDILDISNIEAGSPVLEETECPVATIVEKCARLIAPLAEKKAIDLEVEQDGIGSSFHVYGDQTKLLQILINLMNNGVKFTPRGGRVRLSVSAPADGTLVFEVSDTGVGMRAEDIPNAMKPFVQVDGSHSRAQEGTGLGLPLSKMLTELHDGSFRVESEPGKGTTVTVVLPPHRLLRAAAVA